MHQRLWQLQWHHVVRNLANICIGGLAQALDFAKQVAKGFLEHVAVQRPFVIFISYTAGTDLPRPAQCVPTSVGCMLAEQQTGCVTDNGHVADSIIICTPQHVHHCFLDGQTYIVYRGAPKHSTGITSETIMLILILLTGAE